MLETVTRVYAIIRVPANTQFLMCACVYDVRTRMFFHRITEDKYWNVRSESLALSRGEKNTSRISCCVWRSVAGSKVLVWCRTFMVELIKLRDVPSWGVYVHKQKTKKAARWDFHSKNERTQNSNLILRK